MAENSKGILNKTHTARMITITSNKVRKILPVVVPVMELSNVPMIPDPFIAKAIILSPKKSLQI